MTTRQILEEVKKRILAEPKQFVMASYFSLNLENEIPHTFPSGEAEEKWIETHLPNDISIPNCGTAACIAGHILCIKEEKKPKNAMLEDGFFIEFKVSEFLNVSQVYTNKLFDLYRWPVEFRDKFNAAPIASMERAQVACEMIDWWMKDVESHGINIDL